VRIIAHGCLGENQNVPKDNRMTEHKFAVQLQAATSATPPPVRAMSVGATMQNKTHPSPPPHRKGPLGDGALLGGWSLSCLRPKPPLRAGLGMGSQVLDHRTSRRKGFKSIYTNKGTNYVIGFQRKEVMRRMLKFLG
jgi:hypothetical protein